MKNKFFSRKISPKENSKIRKMEADEIKYARKDCFDSNFSGAPLSSLDLGIIYLKQVYGSPNARSEEYDLKWSYRWPCGILLHASVHVGFPLTALSYLGEVDVLYFPWVLKEKVIFSFIEADSTIDRWRVSRTFFQGLLGELEPEFKSAITQDCISRVESMLL